MEEKRLFSWPQSRREGKSFVPFFFFFVVVVVDKMSKIN